MKDLEAISKEEFSALAKASHKLRTPLTAVKGYISMILEGDRGKISPEVREYLEEALEANDRLIKLIERVVEQQEKK